MKLVFFKENEDIKLKLNNNGTDEEFRYVKLIKFLHVGNELEETEYYDDISDEEKSKIDEMILKINEKVVLYSTNRGEESATIN